jgi:protein-tyrosine-phosphatase
VNPEVRVLFVCTANVSRSPYAQVRMSEVFGSQVPVASAGIPGTEGRSMDPAMEAELPFEDEAALRHRSRVLDGAMLVESDLVLTMEFTHHMRILDRWPEHAPKVFGLRQLVDGLSEVGSAGSAQDRLAGAIAAVRPNSMMWDIADPYRRGRRAARRCADELDDLVLRLGLGLGYEPVAED